MDLDDIQDKSSEMVSNSVKKTSSTIHKMLRAGGIKLKLIGFTIVTIIITVSILSTIIINLMTDSIEKKSFDVVTSSIKYIGDFSRPALLERSYENKLNLSEIINKIKNSNIEGFLDISIYERKKENYDDKYLYLTGFKQYEEPKYLEDQKLMEKLSSVKTETLLREDITKQSSDGKEISAYQFTFPVIYAFQDRTITLGIIVLEYDKEAIYGVIKKTINLALLITSVIIVITTILVYFAGLRFTRPILAITGAANEVANGNLHIDQLTISTNDEIGELSDRFNSMVNGLREREKMQMFVSDSTMDMIQQDTRSKLILGGEYRTSTFLFSDIRGFTSMSESRKPDEVVNIVNFYLNLQSEIIKKNGGDIDKFVGDEVMASFSGENAVLNATTAGYEIQKAIIENNKEREKSGETVCHVGIGINKGEVIVGNIGSHDRMDFTSMGSTVNLAARLCSGAKPDQVLIEENTANEISEKFKLEEIEPIIAKGISHPVKVYSVILE